MAKFENLLIKIEKIHDGFPLGPFDGVLVGKLEG